MAWNKPSTENQQQKKPSAKAPSAKRGVIAGAVVVALGALCLWMFSGGDDAHEAKPNKERGRIKEVTPAKAATNLVAKAKPKFEIRKLPDGRLMKYMDGREVWMFPREPDTPVVITNDTASRSMSFEEKTFKHFADAQIATLLNTQPGEQLMGDAKDYYRFFMRDLKKTKNERIEILPDDPPEVRLLKEDVQAVRDDLVNRMNAGEDVSKAMIDSFNELQELGLYRQELDAEIRRISRDGDFNEKDAKDLLGAANKMLEDRGAKPLRMPGVILHRARVKALKEAEGKQGETK